MDDEKELLQLPRGESDEESVEFGQICAIHEILKEAAPLAAQAGPRVPWGILVILCVLLAGTSWVLQTPSPDVEEVLKPEESAVPVNAVETLEEASVEIAEPAELVEGNPPVEPLPSLADVEPVQPAELPEEPIEPVSQEVSSPGAVDAPEVVIAESSSPEMPDQPVEISKNTPKTGEPVPEGHLSLSRINGDVSILDERGGEPIAASSGITIAPGQILQTSRESTVNLRANSRWRLLVNANSKLYHRRVEGTPWLGLAFGGVSLTASTEGDESDILVERQGWVVKADHGAFLVNGLADRFAVIALKGVIHVTKRGDNSAFILRKGQIFLSVEDGEYITNIQRDPPEFVSFRPVAVNTGEPYIPAGRIRQRFQVRLSELPPEGIALVARVRGRFSRVVFKVDGQMSVTDKFLPYTPAGDSVHSGGAYQPFKFRPGTNQDGDSASDAAEFVGGTNALDANSYLRVIATDYNGAFTEVTIEFTSSPNRIYRIEHTDTLKPPASWTDSGLGSFLGEAGTTTHTFTFPGTDLRFFRVQASLPLADINL